MTARIVCRIGYVLAGLSPWVRRSRQEQAVLAVIAWDRYGLSTLAVANALEWPVEKAAVVLSRLLDQGRVKADPSSAGMRYRIRGGA